jgi:hypothetical protein
MKFVRNIKICVRFSQKMCEKQKLLCDMLKSRANRQEKRAKN